MQDVCTHILAPFLCLCQDSRKSGKEGILLGYTQQTTQAQIGCHHVNCDWAQASVSSELMFLLTSADQMHANHFKLCPFCSTQEQPVTFMSHVRFWICWVFFLNVYVILHDYKQTFSESTMLIYIIFHSHSTALITYKASRVLVFENKPLHSQHEIRNFIIKSKELGGQTNSQGSPYLTSTYN